MGAGFPSQAEPPLGPTEAHGRRSLVPAGASPRPLCDSAGGAPQPASCSSTLARGAALRNRPSLGSRRSPFLPTTPLGHAPLPRALLPEDQAGLPRPGCREGSALHPRGVANPCSHPRGLRCLSGGAPRGRDLPAPQTYPGQGVPCARHWASAAAAATQRSGLPGDSLELDPGAFPFTKSPLWPPAGPRVPTPSRKAPQEPRPRTETADPEGATPPRAPSGRSPAVLCSPGPPPVLPPNEGSRAPLPGPCHPPPPAGSTRW